MLNPNLNLDEIAATAQNLLAEIDKAKAGGASAAGDVAARLERALKYATGLNLASGTQLPSPVTGSERGAERETSPRPAKRARADAPGPDGGASHASHAQPTQATAAAPADEPSRAEPAPAAAAPSPEPLFLNNEAPFENVKIEDQDWGAFPDIPTQDELFGSEPEDGEAADDREPLFEDEEDELDSDDDAPPAAVDPRRQNPDMDGSDSESESESESEAESGSGSDMDIDELDEVDDPEDAIGVDAEPAPAPRSAPKPEPAPAPEPAARPQAKAKARRRAAKKPSKGSKRAKREKRVSEAIFPGQCLRCPGEPWVADMYNHLTLEHRHDAPALGPGDFECERLLVCACGRVAIRATYVRNHLRMCALPLERRVRLGMPRPKEKKTHASKAEGRCNLCDRVIRNLYAHFRSTHKNVPVTEADFHCGALKACCGKVWAREGSRHKCAAPAAEGTAPAAKDTGSAGAKGAADAAGAASDAAAARAPQSSKSSQSRASAPPRPAPNATRNQPAGARDTKGHSDGRDEHAHAPGEGGRPGALPDRLQFLNSL